MIAASTASAREICELPRFSDKARTLEQLVGRLSTAELLPQYAFDLLQWRDARERILDEVFALTWCEGELFVRSASQSEDGLERSLAGHHKSLACRADRGQLKAAIEQVIASYDDPCPRDRVLIQPRLCEVELSGVAFSIEPSTGMPYCVINYDEKSGRTDSVTSGGHGAELQTFLRCKLSPTPPPAQLAPIVALIGELCALFAHDAIDLEFCISGGRLYLLQVRPLTRPDIPTIDDHEFREALTGLDEELRSRRGPQYGLCGERTVFGIMPDWNPAEILGLRPRPLALSLYRELVTDSIWAYQRHNYGYRNLRSHPLLVSLHGVPYIDVRVSANSFIPKCLDDDLASKLTDYYVGKLEDSPEYHDKLEFEVFFTCYTLDLPRRLATLTGFCANETKQIATSLREITNTIIHREAGLWRRDLGKISALERKFSTLQATAMPPTARVYWLLEDCKRYGTLPFAGLARAGFVAMQMLNSLVSVGVLSAADRSAFMASLDTVSRRLHRDLQTLERREFLAQYGHLRPGSYDILSPRYDEAPELYFDWSALPANSAPPVHDEFRLGMTQLRQVRELLIDHGLDDDVLGLFEFIKGAIEGREYAKFVFSRSLSAALATVGELGDLYGLARDSMSYVDIQCIRDLYTSCEPVAARLDRSIELGRERHRWTRAMQLPALIVEPGDVWQFHLPSDAPNFVTTHQATGPVAQVEDGRTQLASAIVLIPSADPGYDWVFTCGIAGLITKFGGANSHMAIRAAELGIPAVIGAGEKRYSTWIRAPMLAVDCENHSVRELRGRTTIPASPIPEQP